MSFFASLLALGLLTSFSFARAQYDYPERKAECTRHSDCPTYSYCHYSYWIGETCQTNYRPADDNSDDLSCRATSADGSKAWPDHSVCRASEGTPEEYAVTRCFEELGFVCRNAYYMPCTTNFDSHGNAGEPNQCPDHFTCTELSWEEEGERRVCLPDSPEVDYAFDCETNFDCGYSDLEDKWTECYSGFCARVVE